MKNIVILLLGIFIFQGCLRYAPLNSKIKVPKEDYIHNEKILRTDGYYFSEKITNFSCYKYNEIDESSNREIHYGKSVDIVVLYNSGGAIVTMNSTWSGKPDTFWHDCNFPDSLNTFDKAREDFEYYVKNIEPKRMNDGKDFHGVFELKDDNRIKFSIYHNVSRFSSNSYVGFYEGEILNDSTFVIDKRWINTKIDESFVEKKYHLKKIDIKPMEKNFMLENRHRFNNY